MSCYFVFRQMIRKELEEHIRKEFADADLTLFGSSCNGFGFSDSDLDFCLTFKSNDDGKVSYYLVSTSVSLTESNSFIFRDWIS